MWELRQRRYFLSVKLKRKKCTKNVIDRENWIKKLKWQWMRLTD